MGRATPRGAGERRGSTQEDVRRHNLGVVLEHLHASGPLSRAELTSRLQLNRSTIAGLVTDLAEAGLVRDRGAERTSVGVGRPSPVVEADPDRVQVLAAVVGVDVVDVARVGLGGVVLHRRRRRLGRRRSAAAVAGLLAAEAAVLADREPGAVLCGLGVAVPGVVRGEDGCVRFAPNLGWVDEPFGAELSRALHRRTGRLPVSVANDADLGLLAEHRRGAAQGVADVVFLAGDVGVGGAVILGGRPQTGAGGYAGELGHLVVRPDGRDCRCGARGCLETEIGLGALARAAGVPDGAESARVAAALRALTAPTPGLVRVGHHLGRGLAGVVNLLNPRLVIIGGLLGLVYPLVADEVADTLATTALAAPVEQLHITAARLGEDAVLIGAAESAWAGVLADPMSVRAGPAPLEPAPDPVRRHA